MPRQRIQSTPLPAAESDLVPGRRTVVMALDTFVGQKGLVVGLTVGRMKGPDIADVHLSELGMLIVERCVRHQEVNYPDGLVVVAGVAQVAGAKERVRKVLAEVEPGTFVLLVCADAKTYDAAQAVLGINLQSANQRSQ